MSDDTITAEYPNSTLSPNAPISVDRSPATIQSTSPSTRPFDENPTSTTSVGVLRKRFGPRFAPGHGDNDRLADVLSGAGVSSLEEYLQSNQTT